MINLKKYAAMLDKFLMKRSKYYESAIKKIYETMINGILKEMGGIYKRFEKNGKLKRADMLKYKRIDALKRNLLLHINTMSKAKQDVLRKQLEESYEYSYDWMAWAIQKETMVEFPHVIGKEEISKRAQENKVADLKLPETLERHRKTIVQKVNQTVDKGIKESYTYEQMADELTDTLDGDYQKAVRTARNETHRVREQGMLDVAERADEGGVVMVKEWMSMHDERVRDSHVVLDGQQVPVKGGLFEFQGHTAAAPSGFGVPSLDINCRCMIGYKVSSIRAQTDEQLARRTFEQYKEINKK